MAEELPECACRFMDPSSCPRRDHNGLLIVVRCDGCGKDVVSTKRKCRCGSQMARFVSYHAKPPKRR